MSTVIKELIAKFSSDTSGLEKGTEKANYVLSTFGKAAVAATATAAAAFGYLAAKQSNVGDELGKMSDRLGVATADLIRLDHAASLAGVSTDSLGQMIKFMQRNMVDAADGNTDLEATFGRLHTSSAELLAMAPDEAFKKIAESLGGITNAAERTNVSMQIFGRGGTEVLQMLKEDFAGAKEEADRFGLTISRLDSEQLDEMNDSVMKIGQAADGAARQFAIGLAPAISSTVENIMASVDAANTFRDAGKTAGDMIVGSLEILRNLLSELKIQFWEMSEGFYRLHAAAQKWNPFEDKDQTLADLAKADELMGKISDEQAKLANRENLTGDSLIGKYLAAESKNLPASAKPGTPYVPRPKTGSASGEVSNGSILDSAMYHSIEDALDETRTSIFALEKSIGEDAKNAAAEYSKTLEEAYKKTIEFNNATANSFIGIKDAFLSGGNAVNSFKKAALSAINEIMNNVIRAASGGTMGGGLFGQIAGSLVTMGAGMFGGGGVPKMDNVYGPTKLPSFAVGTPYVPRDMVAQIHKGEQIIPAGQNRSGGVTINQSVNISAGVAGTVQDEIRKMLPELRRATVAAVQDSRLRGST